MVRTRLEKITAAKLAQELENATRRRQLATIRWRDRHGNQRNTNTIKSKSRSEASVIDRSRGNGQK